MVVVVTRHNFQCVLLAGYGTACNKKDGTEWTWPSSGCMFFFYLENNKF